MATKMAVNNLFRTMPEKDVRYLGKLRPRLLKLEDEIDEEIRAIVFADRAFSGTSALVVTPLRIIEVVERGGLEIIPFSDTTSVRVGPGRKKLFGGHAPSYLLVYWTGGDYTYTLFGDHDWAIRAADTAQSAHELFRLRST